MPEITTLVKDIENLFERVLDGETVEVSDDLINEFGKAVADKVRRALSSKERVRPEKTLYMSEVGKPCHRQTWYSYHKPELGERLLPHTKMKFLYGDIIEEMILLLARIAGHEVADEQRPVQMYSKGGWTLKGRIDARIDGNLVDVKSASSYSFDKFKKGLKQEEDSFGYLTQLMLYYLADENQVAFSQGGGPIGFLVMNKETGKLHFDPIDHEKSKGLDVLPIVRKLTEALEDATNPPARSYSLEPDRMGNHKLGKECSYCPFKHECWKDANDGTGLRTFVYSTGPVFLGTVHKEPTVPEITAQIKRVRETHTVPPEEELVTTTS